MTRRAKTVLIAAVATFFFGGTVLIAVGIFLFWQFIEGARLSRLGYGDIARKDYISAAHHLTGASQKIVLGENRYWLYMNLATADHQEKRYAEAIRDCTKAIEIDPSRPDAYERRGQNYEETKEIDKASADYARSIEIDPNRGFAHWRRGMLLYDQGDIQEALAEFQEAIRIWPNSAQSFFMRGRCYLSLDDLEPALASFDAALRISPRYSEAQQRRIEVYRKMGQTEKAFLASSEVEAQRPRQRPVPTAPAMAAQQSNKLEVPPLPSFGAGAGTASPLALGTLCEKAEAAYEAKDYDAAIDQYNKALALPMTSRQASMVTAERATCYWQKRDYVKAQADFDEAVKLDPANPQAYASRGFGLARRDELDDALKDFEEAIRLNPHDYIALCYRGQTLGRKGDFQSARADLDKAIELKPASFQAYLDRADVGLRQKAFDQVLSDSSRAMELHPKSLHARIVHIKAHAALGRRQDAENEIAGMRTLQDVDETELRNSIAWFRATWPDDRLRNAAEAVKEAQRACELTGWKSGATLDTLAAAEAEAGNFKDAVKYEADALKTTFLPNVRSRLEERIQGYRAHAPYRELVPD